MTALHKKLNYKRKLLENLREEVRMLERQILEEEWKDKPECEHSFSDISNHKCSYGETYRGMIYCKNPNCHK